MLASVIFFNEPFTNIVTITFSALIVIELLNVYSEVSICNLNINIDQQDKLENDSVFSFHFRDLHPLHRPSQRIF